AERATRSKAIEDLRVKRALSRMREVVDCKAGDHGIKQAMERRKGRIEVVAHHLDGWIGRKSLLEPLEHRVGEVKRHALEMRMNQPHERQQAAVTAPEIKNPA